MNRTCPPRPLTVIRALSVLTMVTLPACELSASAPDTSQSAVPPAEPFHFGTVYSQPIDIFASAQSAPLPGVFVTVRENPASSDEPSGAIWTGLTAADGHAAVSATLANTSGTVQVIAKLSGYRGPYTNEADRAQYGMVAPSAWVTVDATELAHLTLAFEKE